MVNLKKILKLGGFADVGKQVQYFGFARKTMPPDTPHDENKTRWRVNNLGQKVEDAGTPTEQIREKYIAAIETTPDELARTDIVRAVGVMAEKGDEEAGKYLLGLLKTDRSPQVRKVILIKFAFAFKMRMTPFSKMVLEGIRYSVADEESALRGMTVDLLNAAAKKADEVDLNSSIKPQNRRTCIVSREAAWAHLKGVAQAINSSILILGLVDMMSHAVLPVRMTCWEVMGGKDATATTGRCRELEQRLYRRKQALARAGEEVDRCLQAVDDAFDEAMEQSREAVAKKMRQEQDRGVELHAESSFVIKFQKDLVNNDAGYIAAVRELQEREEAYKGIEEDIAADDEAYQRVREELKREILSKIGYLLQDDCPPVAITNKLLGKSGNGSWYLRRTVVRMVGPLAEAGDATATDLLTQSLADRSPYVRRTVLRALKQARWAAGERADARATATVAEAAAEAPQSRGVTWAGGVAGGDSNVSGVGTAAASPQRSPNAWRKAPVADAEEGQKGKATPEERRRLQKARLRKREDLDAKARLASLNIREFGTKEVVALLESMRMHFMEHTDAYKRAARKEAVGGEWMLKASDEELKKVLGMTLRKNRTMLRVTVKDKMAEYARETDPKQIEQSARTQLLTAAIENAARIQELRKEVQDEEALKKNHIKQAMRQDAYMFGGNEGLGCVLFKDAEANTIFKRVLPCDGIISEGDVLLKVEQTPVVGMSLVEVMRLLFSAGQMCPCVVRLASQKQRLEDLRKRRREWEELQASAKKKGNSALEPPPSDLLRTVNVTCIPPPFKEEYIESIGLDVEVYQGDATRSLQMMTVLQRNGFAAYLKPILLDGVKQLVDLARKHKSPEWANSIGITASEHARFMDLLKRLALRFKLKDPRPEVRKEERREHAHDVWRYMQGVTVPEKLLYTCKYRSQDASASLDDFKVTGRTQRQMQRITAGQHFTVLWHEKLGIMVEFLHSSTGTFRISVPQPLSQRRFAASRGLETESGGVREDQASKRVLSEGAGGGAGEAMIERRASSAAADGPEGGGRKEVVACFSNGRREAVRGFRAGALVEKVKEGVVPGVAGGSQGAEEAEADLREATIPEHPESLSAPPSPFSGASHAHGQSGLLPAISRRGSGESRTASHHSATGSQHEAFRSARRREGGDVLPSVFGSPLPDGSFRGGEGLVRSAMGSGRSFAAELPVAWAGGEGFGIGGLLKRITRKEPRLRRQSVEAESVDEGLDEDDEEVVGYHLQAEEGMRVRLRQRVTAEMPELVEENGDTVGTITWVDPDDADGDGVTGDICEVRWDNGFVGDYRTGFDGGYRLAKVDDDEDDLLALQRRDLSRGAPRAGPELVIGLDIPPSEGQRVVMLQSALAEIPDLLADCGGGPGIITWVDPDDADGDGVIGDICEVLWDNTGVRGDYRTGFEGVFRLGLYKPPDLGKGKAGGAGDEEALGKSGLARTQKDAPEEDPWAFLDEWEEQEAAARRAEDRRKAGEDGPSLDLQPRKMSAEGRWARVEAGSWEAVVKSHGEDYGTTIEVRMPSARAEEASPERGSGRPKPGATAKSWREEPTLLEAAHAHCEEGGLAVQLMGDGVVVMVHDRTQGEGATLGIGDAAQNSEAFRVMADGLTEMSSLEATLLVEGVPLHGLKQAVADVMEAEGNSVAQSRLQEDDEDAASAPSAEGSRPSTGVGSGGASGARMTSAGSATGRKAEGNLKSKLRPVSRGSGGPGTGSLRVSRAGTPGSLPRPCSSRSGQLGAQYGRPVTPLSQRPYTPSRPSSQGSVRHRLNIDNSFGFETDMQMEPKSRLVDAMWGDQEGSEEVARARQYHQQEANLLITDY